MAKDVKQIICSFKVKGLGLASNTWGKQSLERALNQKAC